MEQIMEFFIDWVVPVICVGLAIYFYKNPVDDNNPIIYAILLIICLALKMSNFAQIIAN